MYRHALVDLFKEDQLDLPLNLPLNPVQNAPVKSGKKPSFIDASKVDKNILNFEPRSRSLKKYINDRGSLLNEDEILALALKYKTPNAMADHTFYDADAIEGVFNKLNHINEVTKNDSLKELTDICLDELIEKNVSRLPTQVIGSIIRQNPESNRLIKQRQRSLLLGADLTPSHTVELLQKNPDIIRPNELGYKGMSNILNAKVLDHLNSSGGFDSLDRWTKSSIIRRLSEGDAPDTSPHVIKKILDRADDMHTSASMLDNLLDRLNPADRKDFIDRKIGMKGSDVIYPELKNTDNDWQNRTFGKDKHDALSEKLASSRHLNDEQIDFIKKHGSFADRYEMYHNNKNIDHRHGLEMFKKWFDNHDSHGYSSDELNQRNSQEFEDHFSARDLPEDVQSRLLERPRDRGHTDDLARELFSEADYFSTLPEDEIVSEMGNSFDDFDEIYSRMMDSDYDWTAENPHSKQNIGKKDFDALDALAQRYDKDHAIDLDDFKEVTGYNHPSEIGLPELYDEKRDYIDMEDVHNKLDEYGGPSIVDYSNHDKFAIDEHPEWSERYDNEADSWRRDYWQENMHDVADRLGLYDGYYESPGYQNALRDAEDTILSEHPDTPDAIRDHLFSDSHTVPDFIPRHLHAHLPAEMRDFEDLKRKKQADGGHTNFLNSFIPDRSYDHEFGEDQHLYETVKKYAEANNGSIDIGTMHKLFPAQKEKWKQIFGEKSKLSSDDIQQKIDAIPKKKYRISYGKWNSSSSQNLNGRDQIVVRLEHSPESMDKLRQDSGLFNTFEKIQDASRRSGHPTTNSTVGWVRVDMSDPKKPFIDEMQSDFEKSVRSFLQRSNMGHLAEHVGKIESDNQGWREALMSFVLNMFKKNGAQQAFTHSPESKKSHTGSGTTHSCYDESYRKTPKSFGFKQVDASQLPLSSKGLDNFKKEKEEEPEKRFEVHRGAMRNHFQFADSLMEAGIPSDHPLVLHHSQMAEKHMQEGNRLIGEHGLHPHKSELKLENIRGYRDFIPQLTEDAIKSGKPAVFDGDDMINQPLKPAKYLSGHALDLNPVLKKHIELVDILIKAELNLINSVVKKENIMENIQTLELIRRRLYGY